MKDKINFENIYPQGMFTCSVCNKEFKADDNTRFIVAGGYTCSLKCFLDEVKRREAIKVKQEKEKEKIKNNKKDKNK